MKVTIIIPNYNGKHFMEPCLQSLSEQTCRDFKVLVVDNASSDGSLEYMSEHYPDIEVISLKKNYGFSKAVNVGIEHSTTPYVILLNNDTTVDTHYVEEMIKAIEKSPRIFSVSSKMIQMYHPDLMDDAERDEALRTIEKTRYLVPFEGHTLEIDVFPFWRDRAFCECELQSEDEPLPLPDWLHVYREVTDDPRYTNRALARSVPDEIL